MSIYIPPGGVPQVDATGASRVERIRLRRVAGISRRGRIRQPRPPTSRPHQFDPDPATPGDEAGREFCLWCRCPGQPGDARHPDGAPSMRPATPPDAVERDARMLGERP